VFVGMADCKGRLGDGGLDSVGDDNSEPPSRNKINH